MISLVYLSYMDKKKYLILFVYQLIIISVLIIMCNENDNQIEMMLNSSYYRHYYEQLFIQIFTILNVMFVLFLSIDHDQLFFKPLYCYFFREKVILSKYLFHMFWIILCGLNTYMLMTVIFWLLIPFDIKFNLIMLIDLSLDMFIVLNLILILIKSKFKTLSVVIVLVYILSSLFIPKELSTLYYIFPIFNMDKSINILELIYKICYIYLGFLIYYLKSMTEDV